MVWGGGDYQPGQRGFFSSVQCAPVSELVLYCFMSEREREKERETDRQKDRETENTCIFL